MKWIRDKKIYLGLAATFVLVTLIGVFAIRGKSSTPEEPQPRQRQTLEQPINQIDISERPYVELQPLVGRNQVQLTIHSLKLDADEVEVILEYDRNRGVMDAVLRQFPLTDFPHREMLFLGSRSAGGHITYHDDVIGGTLRLNFSGSNDYILEVPWRYDDSQPQYSRLSTSDGFFQIELATPIYQRKVVVMQSPGLPQEIDGEVLAGPYLVRSVGNLPNTQVDLTIRLPQANSDVVLMGWNGDEWREIPAEVEGRSLTAEADLLDAYVVITP